MLATVTVCAVAPDQVPLRVRDAAELPAPWLLLALSRIVESATDAASVTVKVKDVSRAGRTMKGFGLLAVSQAVLVTASVVQTTQPESQLVLAAQPLPAALRTHSKTRLLRLMASPRA